MQNVRLRLLLSTLASRWKLLECRLFGKKSSVSWYRHPVCHVTPAGDGQPDSARGIPYVPAGHLAVAANCWEIYSGQTQKNIRHFRLSLPWKSVSVQSVDGANFVLTHFKKYRDKAKYEAIKLAVNKWELFHRYSTFKASLPSKFCEFPDNLPAANFVILRTRAAFNRCGVQIIQCWCYFRFDWQ